MKMQLSSETKNWVCNSQTVLGHKLLLIYSDKVFAALKSTA